MSNLFKNLKSIFVVENASKTGETSSPDQDKSAEEVVEPVQVLDETIDVGEGKVSQKFTDILLRALEANNQEGFDYIEYKRSIQNLFSMNMEEPMMYKSAFAAAQAMGATSVGLVDSAGMYLRVLKKEDDKFRIALANQRKKQVDGKIADLKGLENSINGKEAKIAELTKDIEQTKLSLAKMEGEIENASKKVESTGRNFVASYGNLVAQIQTDIANIKKYLN